MTARRRLTAARPDDDSGVVAIVVALLTTVFIGLAALVVDHGLAADTELRAKNAADASALAAALVLSSGGTATDADTAARLYAGANFAVTATDWKSCTTALPGGYSRIATTDCISQNAATRRVRVVLPNRIFATIFAGIAGFSRQTVTGAAEAAYGATPGGGCVLCIMGKLDGQEGDILVRGGSAYAHDIDFNPNTNGFIHVTGGTIGYTGSLTGGGDFLPSPPSRTSDLQDPFLSIPQPVVDTNKVAIAGSGACRPADYYYDISGCTSFDPGVYVLLGTDQHIANVSATNVMFFLTCSTTTGPKKTPVVKAKQCDPVNGEPGANFGGAGNASVVLSGLTSDPTYKGFALWVDRKNTTGQTWTGNSDFKVVGTLYSPNAAGLDSTKGNGKITVVKGTAVLGSLQMKGHHVHLDVDGTGSTTGGGAAVVIPRLSQ